MNRKNSSFIILVTVTASLLLHSSVFGKNFLIENKKSSNAILENPEKKLNINRSPTEFATARINDTYVRVIDSIYNFYNFGLTAVCNGEFQTTGDCSPQIKVGLIKKNNIGQWDTIVNIEHIGTFMCGVGNYICSNDTIEISLPHNYYPEINDFSDFSGAYKLTFFAVIRGKKIKQSSNEFLIKPFSIPFTAYNQPKAFLDTTIVRSYQFGKLEFIHMRVFTIPMYGVYKVWHQIRIPQINNHFDKVFTYNINPYSENNDIFAVEDFNLDGWMDFRIKNEFNGYDYYLYELYNSKKEPAFIYSEIFSCANSLSIEPEASSMTAEYSFEVPLENNYNFEAIFSLPSLRLTSLNRIYFSENGKIREPIDTSQLFFPARFSPTVSQPEIQVLYGNSPKIVTNKKHYFPTDSVFLISNGMDNLNDISKLDFVIEVIYPDLSDWRLTPPNPYLKEKILLKTNNGFKIKVGDVYDLENLEFAWNGLLTVGTYRIKVFLNEKIVGQTPDFYVHI